MRHVIEVAEAQALEAIARTALAHPGISRIGGLERAFGHAELLGCIRCFSPTLDDVLSEARTWLR